MISNDFLNIIFLLTYIVNLDSNNSISIRDLLVKTAFLVILIIASCLFDLKHINLDIAYIISTNYFFDCIALRSIILLLFMLLLLQNNNSNACLLVFFWKHLIFILIWLFILYWIRLSYGRILQVLWNPFFLFLEILILWLLLI